jgi:endonuclease YncB( thermonuclease family)
MTRRLALVPPLTVPAARYVNATLVEVHDGDTFRCLADRLDDDLSEWNIRVLGAAANELDDPGGPEAGVDLARRLPVGTAVVLAGLRPDKYGGRHLARVFYAAPDGTVLDLAEQLVLDGWAAPWDGKGEQPRPAWPRIPTVVEQPLAA